MFSKKISLSLAAMAASVLTVSAAQASFTATFTNGANSTSLTGAAGVISPTPVTVGDFSILSFNANSYNPDASMGITGASVKIKNNSTSSVQTLTIDLGDTGFTQPVGSNLNVLTWGTLTWYSSDTQNGSDVVSEVSDLQNNLVVGSYTSNTLKAHTAITDLSTYMPETTAASGTLVAGYSMGNELTVVLNPGDEVNVAWNTQVAGAPAPLPEPTSVSLMGMGGLGALLLLGGRRKIKA